jgi:hypothetical protein
MVRINLVVRELGRLKPDYSLDFELPEVPAIGAYISIQRPDHPEPYGEDVIVRKIWWRLNHSETAASAANPPKVGGMNEIFVECDVAMSPYSSDNWLKWANAGKARGANVEEFEVARFSVRESEFNK